MILKQFSKVSNNIKIYLLLTLFSINILAVGEGSKETLPQSTDVADIEVGTFSFADYGCSVDKRLQIHIKNIGEKIYYGFGSFDLSNVVYRIKDASGNIVVPETTVPSAGAGCISTYTQAVSGPNTINTLGYTPLLYTPITTGDFYIEFSVKNTMSYFVDFNYFDITVANSANIPIKGRVWSKTWCFYTEDYVNAFNGKMYSYSNDSVVTSVNFNGMQPCFFTLTINSKGVANSGNPLIDRKSVSGDNTFPEYKIFLNNPDSLVYISGTIGHFNSPISFSGCVGNYCINVNVNKAGKVRSIIDLNGIPGYQAGTSDLEIITNVNVGSNCIPWDGLDGLGNPILDGTSVKLSTKYISGITHMPIYDVENNVNGFIVDLVRPTTSTTSFNLFWDDTNLPGGTISPVNGCNSATGCHSFSNDFGNEMTINTWWYASNNVENNLDFIYKKLTLNNNIHVKNVSCPGLSDGKIEISSNQSRLSYSINRGGFQPDSVFNNLTKGTYFIQVDNGICTLDTTITITEPDSLQGIITTSNDTCNSGVGRAIIQVQSGRIPYSYLWNGNSSYSSSMLDSLGSGLYTVLVKDSAGCGYTFSDSVKNISSILSVSGVVIPDTCGLGKGSITITTTNGFSPLSYSWNTSPLQMSKDITSLKSGSYNLTIKEKGLCTTTKDYVISDINGLTASPFTIPTLTCLGDTITMNYVSKSSLTYNITAPSGTIITNATGTATISYNTSGKHYISLTTNRGTCSETYMDSIEVVQLDSIPSTIKNVSCFGLSDGSITLNSLATDLNYSMEGSSFKTDPTYTNLAKGSYNIEIQDSNGCKIKETFKITEPNLLAITLSSEDASCDYICDGQISGQISGGTQPYSYKWNDAIASKTLNLKDLCVGDYTIEVIDTNGCKANKAIKIENSTPLLSNFDYYFNTGYRQGNIVDFSFTGYGAEEYSWNFEDSSSTEEDPTHIFAREGIYNISLIVNSGLPNHCVDTIVKQIKIELPSSISAPTAFTPNGDGLNDRFVVFTTNMKTYKIYIYNRNGQEIFHSEDENNSWDGIYKGEKAPAGVYAYLVVVVDAQGKQFKKRGAFTLIR